MCTAYLSQIVPDRHITSAEYHRWTGLRHRAAGTAGESLMISDDLVHCGGDQDDAAADFSSSS